MPSVFAVGLVLVLVGCLPIVDGVDKVGEGAKIATPSDTSHLEGDENGDGKLSEFEKQIFAKNALRDFAMPDGTMVMINPKEPLPPAVKELLVDQAASVVTPMQNNKDFTPENIGSLEADIREWADTQAEATGKSIVVVFSMDDGTGRIGWGSLASGRKTTGVTGGYDRDAVVGRVQSWANQTGYEAIVTD